MVKQIPTRHSFIPSGICHLFLSRPSPRFFFSVRRYCPVLGCNTPVQDDKARRNRVSATVIIDAPTPRKVGRYRGLTDPLKEVARNLRQVSAAQLNRPGHVSSLKVAGCVGAPRIACFHSVGPTSILALMHYLSPA